MTTKKPEKKAAAAPKTLTAAEFRSAIATIAADPSTSDERLALLIALRTEMEKEHSDLSWATALNACQKQMTTISKDSDNPQTRSKYASYEQLDKALRPIYTEAGFSVTFTTCPDECLAEMVRVKMSLMHIAGGQVEYLVEMPCDGKGAKGNQVMTRTHATGSALTYARRYLLCLAFNISTGDDDGNSAGGKVVNGKPREQSLSDKVKNSYDDMLSDDEANMLTEMSGLVEANAERFVQHLTKLWGTEITAMSDIPSDKYTEAYEMLYAKGKKNGTISD